MSRELHKEEEDDSVFYDLYYVLISVKLSKNRLVMHTVEWGG